MLLKPIVVFRYVGIPLLIIGLGAGVVEGALRLTGYSPIYPPELLGQAPSYIEPDPYRLYLCDDEQGCRLNPQARGERYCHLPENPHYRLCRINAQGYSATFDYVPENVPEGGYRVLLLGDSFTWGLSARPGHSWAEILDQTLNQQQPTTVWNAAIIATGTNQAITSARELLPVLRPQVVILGFYGGNDFSDNLFPLNNAVSVQVDDTTVIIQPYYLDTQFRAQRLSDENIYLVARGYPPALNGAQRFLRQTALYSWIERQITQRLAETLPELHPWVLGQQQRTESAQAIANTTEYLRQLKTLVESHGARLIVLNIPSPFSYENRFHGQSHLQQLRQIAQTLNLEVIEVFDQMTLDDFAYVTDPYDLHWNDSGHAIAGRIVSEYVQGLIAQGALAMR